MARAKSHFVSVKSCNCILLDAINVLYYCCSAAYSIMLYTFSIIILWLLEKNYYIGNFFISDNVLEFLSKKLFLRSCDVIF